MSLYQIGCCLPVAGAAFEEQEYMQGLVDRISDDYQVGALVATPGFIRDQVNALHAEVLIADREIAKQAGLAGYGGTPNARLEAWWRAVWIPYMKAWTDFRNDHQGWSDNLWGSVLDTVADFRYKLRDLRTAAERDGFRFTSPTPRPPEESWAEQLAGGIGGVGRFVKNVVYVLLALAGGYILYKFFVVHKGGSPRLLAA